jgi:ADP-ribose pyrophosphatase YjhB (NUDIX family)
VFYLPGGKPEAGESARQTPRRELGEELGVVSTGLLLLGQVEEIAALEKVPMRMTVFLATIGQEPRPAAELAALGCLPARRGLGHYRCMSGDTGVPPPGCPR